MCIIDSGEGLKWIQLVLKVLIKVVKAAVKTVCGKSKTGDGDADILVEGCKLM